MSLITPSRAFPNNNTLSRYLSTTNFLVIFILPRGRINKLEGIYTNGDFSYVFLWRWWLSVASRSYEYPRPA